jgi:hypothetical protein
LDRTLEQAQTKTKTTKGQQALLHGMLIDEFDSIFEKRWTVTRANGESSANSTMSTMTFF